MVCSYVSSVFCGRNVICDTVLRFILLFRCIHCATESAFLYFLLLFERDNDLINCEKVMQ